MLIEKLKTERLIPADYNPRKDLKPSDPEYDKLKHSIEQFGCVEPIIWNKITGRVVGGHQRLKVLLDMGITETECVVVELDAAKEKALNLALNKIQGDWDQDKLALVIADLKGADFDISLTGFDLAEIDALFKDALADGVEDDEFDLASALEEASFVQCGDVWTLGRHRLVCGDATKTTDVTLLMDGRKADLVLTDPPYAVSYKSASGLSIKNDNLKTGEFYKFLLDAFRNMAENLESGSSAYVFHADTEGLNFRRAYVDAGFHLSGVCIWVKNSFVMGRSPYQWQHEPILFGWLKNGKHKWYAGRAEKTVWSFAKPRKNEEHPTSKPLDLLAYPIKNSSKSNGVVLDLFGGSGSTLIACEQTDRICYMMELDEKYASVILRRYVKFKGGSDEVSVFRSGVSIPYQDVAKDVKRKGDT